MLTRRVVCCGLVLMLGAALAAVPAAAVDKSDLAGRATVWEKEYNAGNLAGVVALYASDGCRMPPNQEAVHGSDAIRAQLKAGKDRGLAKVKIAVTAAESSGDVRDHWHQRIPYRPWQVDADLEEVERGMENSVRHL
jgi:hypothetical protein